MMRALLICAAVTHALVPTLPTPRRAQRSASLMMAEKKDEYKKVDEQLGKFAHECSVDIHTGFSTGTWLLTSHAFP